MADNAEQNTPPDATVSLSLPLPYQQEIFHEVRQKDGLLILAPGLGLLRIVANLLHAYDLCGNSLILLVGADERENGWIGELMAEQLAAAPGPARARAAPAGLTIVNTDIMSSKARARLYRRGGVFSITSRILVVDFLSGLLDPATVTGMLVLHADRVSDLSTESFILRIYRERNQAGFLKAFSDSPESFTTGFSPLSKMLANLFLDRTFIYPRFQLTVAASLERDHRAEVIELEVDMTTSMKAIQLAIIDCIQVTLADLKKANPGLDVDDWTVDAALHRSFDGAVRRQLEPVWHRTSFKTRLMVRDLALLRAILWALLSNDSVTFNKYIDSVKAASIPPPGSTRSTHSPWILLDAAETLFVMAKSRAYTGDIIPGLPLEQQAGLVPVLEEQPKWALLAEIMDEIDQEMLAIPTPDPEANNKTVLVMCSEQSTCAQLRDFLQTMHIDSSFREEEEQPLIDGVGAGPETVKDRQSGQIYLRRKLRNYIIWKRDLALFTAALEEEEEGRGRGQSGQDRPGTNSRAPIHKRRRMRGGAGSGPASRIAGSGRSTPLTNPPNSAGSGRASSHITGDKDAHMASVLNSLRDGAFDQDAHAWLQDDFYHNRAVDESGDCYELFEQNDLVLVHPYDGDQDEHLLEQVKPMYIVMYEPDPAFIRRVEVFRNSHPGRQVRVYFLYYNYSVENQKYLSVVRREKDAFARLIKERASMGLTINRTKKANPAEEAFLRSINTRIAGGGLTTAAARAAAPCQPRVVVDVREFRSALPSMIHARGMEVVPAMLTVGDYVLSPETVVERKSVKDLIGSLNNGRLHGQAVAMLRHYRYAVLLIEFDRDRAFTLETFVDLSLGPAGQAGQAGAGAGSVNVAAHSRFAAAATTGAGTTAAGADLQTKLVMLTMAFPGLRIVWATGPDQSADLFSEMKRNQKEPDLVRAVEVGLDDDENEAAAGAGAGAGADGGKGPVKRRSLYATVPGEMLLAIPGMTLKAARAIQDQVLDMATLANMDEAALEPVVGPEIGRKISRFFGRSIVDG